MGVGAPCSQAAAVDFTLADDIGILRYTPHGRMTISNTTVSIGGIVNRRIVPRLIGRLRNPLSRLAIATDMGTDTICAPTISFAMPAETVIAPVVQQHRFGRQGGFALAG